MAGVNPWPDTTDVMGVLARIGAAHYGRYPWHARDDPYVVLLAEVLLQRTKRVVVARVLPQLLAAAPDAATLAGMDTAELERITWSTGLASRARRLRILGAELVTLGGVPSERDALLGLSSVGGYVADAVRLYAFSCPAFPLDRNVQRVLTRVFHGETPDGKLDPNADARLRELVEALVPAGDASSARNIHQGVLSVAWSNCGPHPKHQDCPLRDRCRLAEVEAS